MLHCFLDDSGKESSTAMPWICMAGYVAEFDALVSLNTRWVQLLIKHDISEIHMKDLIPIEGEYKQRNWDKDKRNDVLGDFLQAIRETSLIGVGAALEMSAWRKLKKEQAHLITHGNAQEFLLMRICRMVIDRLRSRTIQDQIAMVFDTDPEFGPNRLRLFCALMAHDNRIMKRFSSITFGVPIYYPGF